MNEMFDFLEGAFYWFIFAIVLIALFAAILEGYYRQKDKYERRKMIESYLKEAEQWWGKEGKKWKSCSQSQSSSATSNTPEKS